MASPKAGCAANPPPNLKEFQCQKLKLPPPYTWIAAPIGWWFKGPFNRKLAHVWPGSDGRTYAQVLKGDDPSPRGPFESEDSALFAIAQELTPKAEDSDGH